MSGCQKHPAPNALPPSTSTVATTYFYDALDRFTKKSYSDGTTPTVSFGYDADASTLTCANAPSLTDSYPKGERTAMCDGSGATSWAHDKMGRVATEKQLITGSTAITNAVQYSYNLDGSLATLTYPSGRVITYTPNGSGGAFTAGRSVSAIDAANSINYVTSATYAPQGGIAGFTNGASITGIETYNVRMQPWELYYTSGSAASASQLQQTACPTLPQNQVATIMHRAYDFHLGTNNNGNVYAINNCLASDRTQNFDYDSLNRIQDAYTTGTSSAPTNWGATFSTDPWGNMYNVGPYTGRANFPPALTAAATTKNQLTGFGCASSAPLRPAWPVDQTTLSRPVDP